MILHLTELDSLPPEKVIELDRLVGGRAILILRAFAAYPKVHIPREAIRVGSRIWAIGVEHDVRVASVEFAVPSLGARYHLELLNPPNLQALCRPGPGWPHPLHLAFRGGCLDLGLEIAAKERHVCVLPRGLRLVRGAEDASLFGDLHGRAAGRWWHLGRAHNELASIRFRQLASILRLHQTSPYTPQFLLV